MCIISSYKEGDVPFLHKELSSVTYAIATEARFTALQLYLT